MEIRIACEAKETIDMDSLYGLQGNLKDLSEVNYQKLHDAIVKFGFSFPIHVWINPEGKHVIIDGHQRIRVLKKMRDEEGYTIPPLPISLVYADDLADAKQKLLLDNSSFGVVNQEGFDEYIADIPLENVSDMLAGYDVMFETNNGIENEPSEDKPRKEVECPSCHTKFIPTP